MTLRLTAILLIAACTIFLVGAGFWLVREFEQPLALRLAAVARHHRRWMWIHAWMCAGTLISVPAIASLVALLRNDRGGWPAATALVLFPAGCVAFLGALIVGMTATRTAAAAANNTGSVPPAYVRVHRLASRLHVVFMMLSYATFVLLGLAMLRGSLMPAWVAWVGVTAGLAGLVGYPLLRGGPFAPPIIAHSFGLLVGIVILLRL